jgi:hypothetical protein
VVWLPTVHAAAHLAARRAEGHEYDIPAEWAGGVLPTVAERIDDVPPISLLDEGVRESLDDVLALVAQHDLILATGHVGRDEVFHLMDRTRHAGVRKVVVTHAVYDPPGLQLGDMQAVAAAGAFIELSYVMLDMGTVSAAENARILHGVGPDRVVLTTDLGQVDRMAPAEGLARFAEALAREGVSPGDIEMAMHRNPWALMAGGDR